MTPEDEGKLDEPIHGIFTPLGAASITPPGFILENFVPAGLVFVAGPPKASRKSTIALGMALLVSGHRHAGFPADLSRVRKSGPALIFSAEATAGELHYMAEAGYGVKLDVDDESILVADDPFQFRLDDPDALDRLLFWLHERDPRILVLDPLVDLHAADEKDSGAMVRVLRPVRQWAVEHDSTVLCVHHTRKPVDVQQQKYDPLDMRGSSAIWGKADGALIITPLSETELEIKAVFKRAGGWTRKITLGVWGQKSTPELTPFDRQVALLVKNSSMTVADMGRRLQASPNAILESLKRIKEVES